MGLPGDSTSILSSICVSSDVLPRALEMNRTQYMIRYKWILPRAID